MDNLAHSLVGLTSAKAGLDRLSPYATTVCIISANAADADLASLFFGDRWTVLHHHRGITHSIVGTIGIGLLVPLLAFALEQVMARLRRRATRIRLGGLLIASLIAAATHPFMDWTNNYGVRPLLPWSGRWFYGDLVFIMDPYIWLMLGTIGFLLTSRTRKQIVGWALVATCATAVIILGTLRGAGDRASLAFAITIWIAAIIIVVTLRMFQVNRLVGQRTAGAALILLLMYWGGLALMHRAAYAKTIAVADTIAARHDEKLIRGAAMPMVATPLRWQSIVETDLAMYRFRVVVGARDEAGGGNPIERFEKPKGETAQLISVAERSRPAQIMLDFARFPLAELSDTNCVGRTLVQLADLRYTEPGAARGNFSVEIPVDCPAR